MSRTCVIHRTTFENTWRCSRCYEAWETFMKAHLWRDVKKESRDETMPRMVDDLEGVGMTPAEVAAEMVLIQGEYDEHKRVLELMHPAMDLDGTPLFASVEAEIDFGEHDRLELERQRNVELHKDNVCLMHVGSDRPCRDSQEVGSWKYHRYGCRWSYE